MQNYHVYGPIGKGRFSSVYKGRRKKTIQYYAIKSVEKSQKPSVLQEVRTLHSLEHENILRFYDWYETSNHLWLILEYCVGGDLQNLLRQDKMLPEESIHDFARDILKALQFLHSKSVVYCDLKPSNILLDENGRLKLCDFGLARTLTDISKESVQQLPATKRGTLCYMAPELLEAGAVHSFSSDHWALGCVMYECYAGRPPFDCTSLQPLLSSIINQPPPPLPGNPSLEFQDLVFRLLQKDPRQRIQWEDLKAHPFWRERMRELPLPEQPAFDKFVQQRLGVQSKAPGPKDRAGGAGAIGGGDTHSGRVTLGDVSRMDRNAVPLEVGVGVGGGTGREGVGGAKVPLREISQNANAGVNVLRLSRIVRSNLVREMEGEQYRQPDSGHGSMGDITLDITHDLELNFAEGEQGEGNTSEEEEGDGGGRVGSNGGKTSSKASTPGKDGSSSSHSSEHESGGGKAHLTPARGSGREQENTGGELMSRGRRGSNATPRLEQAASPAVVDARGAGDGRRRQQRAVVGGGVEVEGVQGWQGEREVGGEGLHARVEVEGVEESVSSRVSRTMWHKQSDLVVKPIMLNRRIEKIPDPVYEARHLSFIPKSADALEKASGSQAEAFISTVVASLANSPTQTEKMNTLGYLESLSGSTGASNVLINSSLMTFLVKQLRTARQPNVNVRVQLISLMGLLIRHATLIREGLAASGIVSVLADCLRDEHERVRRRAMASLGELLFYIATQSKLPGANHAAWQVPATTISLVNALLRKGEEETTQHYAVKTIENVASEEGGEWGARFATAENLGNLCHIYKHANSKQEHLKLTAGMCLVRLARFGQSWVQVLVDKFGVRELVVGLGRGTAKEQQIHINLLTMALLGGQGGQGGALGKQLAEDKTLVPAMSALLDNSSEVLRGKALLCSALLCNANRQLLLLLCTSKLVPAVERLRRDRDEYVRGCLETLVSTIVALVPPIMAQIAADARGVKVQAPQAGSRAQQQLRKSLDLFQMLLHLITSGPFRGRIVDATLLRQLAGFLVHLEGPGFEGQEEFQATLMSALEALSQHTDLLLRHRCAVQDHLLPALLSLQMRAASGDMQAMCLKILTDILGAVAAEEAGEGEEQLTEFVRNDLLPLFPSFLKKEDPMPMYAQKLLLALLDHRVIQVADIHRLQLTPKFFELLCGDFEALNTPTVLLCLALTGSPQVDTRMLSSLQVVAKLGALLENIYDKQMETFLEHVLALCHLFLQRDADESGAGRGAGGGGGGGKGHRGILDIVDFGQYSDMFLEISGSFAITIAEVSGECLQYCMDVAPVESAEGLLRNAFLFQNLLESPATEHPHVLVHKLQQQHMLALVVALREQQQEPLVDPEILQQHSALMHVVSGLRESPNSEVASIADELLSELEQL